MKEVDKIIYQYNDTYTRMYRGSVLEYQKKIDYLSFTAIEDSSVGTKITGTISPAPNVEYSRDKNSWSDLTANTVSLTAGETIYVRGNNPNSLSISNANYFSFTMTGNISAGGSVATLIQQKDNSVVPAERYFTGLFRGCSALKNVDNLKLAKADNMTGCYAYCFMLTGLTTVPDDFIENCGMAVSMFNSCFRECLSLTKAPRLPEPPIPILPQIPAECYANMFNRCTALTDVSNIDLSELELDTSSCLQMFYNCSSLTKAARMVRTTFIDGSQNNLFAMYANSGVSDVSGINFGNIVLTKGCMEQMFSNCKSLVTSPALSSRTLAERCYWHLYTGCNALNYIKCTATDISATDCTTDWVTGVANTGTFVKTANMENWTTGTSGIPVGWTVEDV